MANLFDEKNKNDLLADVSQDETMDLRQLINRKKTSDSEGASLNPTNTQEIKETPVNNQKPTVTESSPIKKQLGLSITREEFEAGQERTEFRSVAESDERLKAIQDKQTELDYMMKQRAAIIPLKQYETSTEFSQMMYEMSLVRFDEFGNAFFDAVDDDGNRIVPKMIRLRTENDPPYSRENDALQMERDETNRQRIQAGLEPIPADVPLTAHVEKVDSNNTTEDVSDDAKKKTVQFIIDKTGLGYDFALTDEEKAKLVEANEIRLTNVEVLDIESITTVKPDRESFAGKIHEYTLSGSKTTISFPASGFKADMLGLTYGEVGDISLSMDSINVDKYYKRLSIIYNKMKNISSGPFESFEDFLKNIAYTDISLAIYGLYVSTFPEVQSVSLRCGKNTCQKTFDWNYSTRNVLQLHKSDEVLLTRMKELAAADPDQYDDIYAKAPVRNIQYIKLPKCGYIVGLGIASAYEFLYNFIPILDEKTFKDAFGEDINQVYMNNVLLLTTVLSVRVPDPNRPGTYILCEGYKDILDAIYNINPEEIKILTAISSKIQREYQVYFSFGDVVCPHCKNVTKDLEMSIDELVFQTYQRLLSTEIDLTNFRSI